MLIPELRQSIPASMTMCDAPVPILPVTARSAVSRGDPLARIRSLLQRFRLPDLSGEDEPRARDEAEACTASGMAEALHLAGLLGCLARCSSTGPLVADGLWGGSAVLAACGIVCIAGDSADGEDLDLPDLAPPARAGALGPPRLLIGAAPEELLDLLRLELPALHVEAQAPGVLHMWVVAESDDIAATASPVELVHSALLSLVRGLQRQVEQHACLWIDEDCLPTGGDETGRALASWQPYLPDLPHWVRGRSSAAGSVAEVWHGWCAAAPSAVPATVRAALRTRAYLAWFFSYLASQHVASAWAVLLSSAGPVDATEVAAAAQASGCALSLPTVLEPHLEWKPTGARSVRCGLSVAGATPGLVQALRASLAQDGPFESAFELVGRMPLVAAQLLPLAASGALDSLHHRGLLLGSWAELARWIGQAEAARAGCVPAPAPPELAGPDEMSSRQRLWAEVYAAGSPAALGDGSDAGVDEAALVLPSAVGTGAPGERLRIAGFVRVSRTVHDDGDELVLLALSDGRGTVHILVDWHAAVAALEPGSWASCAAVRTADPRVLLDPAVAVRPASRRVRVTVPRSGDRDVDLECIVRVHEVLDAHPGRHPVAIALQQGERRRLLDLGAPTFVAWRPALVEGLEAVVGRQHVVLEHADTQKGVV